jgi:hypothetical protein
MPPIVLPVAKTSRKEYMNRNPEQSMTVKTRKIGGR